MTERFEVSLVPRCCFVKNCENKSDEGSGIFIQIPDDTGAIRQRYVCAPCWSSFTQGWGISQVVRNITQGMSEDDDMT